MQIIFDTKLSSNLILEYYKKNIFKQLFHNFLLIITLGLFEFYFSHYKYLFYDKTNFSKSNFVKIKNKKSKEIEFMKLKKKKIKLVPHKEKKYLIHFIYKYHLYYYSFNEKTFIMVRNKIIKSINLDPLILKNYKNGLNEEQIKASYECYGKNLINVPKLNIFSLLLEEILSPFTIYQILCVVLWNINGYEIYGDIVLVLTLLSIFASVYEIKSQNNTTRKMAYHEEIVTVKRDGEYKKISSLDLSIGDIIKISSNFNIPCDILLLKGKCIVKEGMLTGETEPIIKSAFKTKNQNIQKNNLILSGSICLLSKNKNDEAEGIVTNTGFYTFKGELVRSLLLGESEEFQFHKDVFYFLLAIICITAIGFIYYVYTDMKNNLNEFTTKKIILRALELFATAVPPTLPLCLTIGLEFAQKRLKKYGIQTIIIKKINEAGRVKIMCFDKTGTLTQNGLIFKGFMIAEKMNEEIYLSEFRESIYQVNTVKKNYKKIIEIMGTCHSLSFLGDEIVGDPLEIEMFENSGFEMFENNRGNNYYKPKSKLEDLLKEKNLKYTLIRKIDFTPERKRFSCIIKDVVNNKYIFFTKGAPEIIIDLSLKNSIPSDLNEKLLLYSQEGYRMLGFCYKEIKESDLNFSDKEIEKDLIFEGLICFENPLKECTKKIIGDLKKAKIENIMITGDNLLTALNVAISCDILELQYNVWSAKLVENNIKWTKISNEIERRKRLSSHDIDIQDFTKTQKKDFGATNSRILRACKDKNTKIILTGDAFEFLYERKKNDPTFIPIIKKTLVYGRSNPEQKALIVETYKKILKQNKNHQYFVGFCGDGANDCPALKKANVGLSLSDLEASIAAPFTSTITDISNVPNLLKEGKASLTTGLQNFKFILCFSLYQFYNMLFTFSLGLDCTSGQYYVIDLMFFFPLTIIMCFTGSNDNLVESYPHSNLINFDIIISMLGGNLLMFLGYGLLYFFIVKSPRFMETYNNGADFEDEGNEDFYYFYAAYYFFLFNQIIAMITGIAFNKGGPFRKEWYQNYYFVGHYFLLGIFIFLMIFITSDFSYYISYFFDTFIRKLDYERTEICLVTCLICFWAIVMYLFERKIVPFLNFHYENRKKILVD